MDQTIESYLEKQTTDALEQMLHDYCASEESLYCNMDTVRLILKELEKREKGSDEEQPPQVQKNGKGILGALKRILWHD